MWCRLSPDGVPSLWQAVPLGDGVTVLLRHDGGRIDAWHQQGGSSIRIGSSELQGADRETLRGSDALHPPLGSEPFRGVVSGERGTEVLCS